MKRRIRFLSAGVLTVGMLAPLARAIDNSTTTISGVTSNAGIITFPSPDTGTNNLLQIVSAGVLVDNQCQLGGAASALGNFVVVSGAGSTWNNTNAINSLFIGNAGSRNQLTVTDNGVVGSGATTYIGNNGHSNVVLVTGNGALMTNGFIYLGNNGSYNQMTISDTGLVVSTSSLTLGNAVGALNQLVITNGGQFQGNGNVIVGDTSTAASNNLVVVSGPGSRLNNNAASLLVGRGLSSGNRLIVSQGAVVINGIGYVGINSTVTSFNVALVTGPGSIWTNTSSLSIGNASSNNTVIITDSGTVFAASVGLGNSFLSLGHDNQLVVTNGGRYFSSGSAVLGDGDNTSSNNTIIVTGAGSVFTNGGLLIGRTSTGNRMIVSRGGLVSCGVGTSYIGPTAASGSDNSVIVTDAGSIWSNSTSLIVGNASGGNRLIVTNGGAVYAAIGPTVGSATLGTNSILVTDGGLLDGSPMVVGANPGNCISNIGGIFQFNVGAPTLSVAPRVSITDGTVSIRNTNNATVAAIANLVYNGVNAFRLNAASNTTSAQTYNFQVLAGFPTNYARLEMINELTAYRGGSVTIGASGAWVFSNTLATIEQAATNYGIIRSYNSTSTFNSVLFNTNAVTMRAHDTFVFRVDYRNRSKAGTTYYTDGARHLFQSSVATQQFELAGIYMGTSIGVNFANNFSLETLELANAATVRVSDAFSPANANDDGKRGALYVSNVVLGVNALLIIDGADVYFTSSSIPISAGAVLVNGGRFAELSPAGTIMWVR